MNASEEVTYYKWSEVPLETVTPEDATFTVTVFGVSRQETLRVKRNDKEQGG